MSTTLLSCQRDAYQRTSNSTVLACKPFRDEPNGGSEYSILTLRDSILYPEGGGQPFDLGTCGGMPVQSVQAGEEDGLVEVVVPAPIAAGSTVECVVDWERRYDFMQQHSCQHLFSAVMWEMFRADTVKWELGSRNVAVDFQAPEGEGLSLTEEQIRRVEERVNHYIRDNRVLSFDVVSRDQLADVPYLRGVPKGAASNFQELRIVTIEGLDANPCGGTHLKSTSEIQVFTIISDEKDRGALRLRFLCGGRVLSSCRHMLQREARLSAALSIPPTEHQQAVESLLLEKKNAMKGLQSMEEEMSVMFASLVFQEWNKQRQEHPQAATSISSIVLHRPGASLGFLQSCADCLLHLSESNNAGLQIVYISSAEVDSSASTAGKSSKKKKKNAVKSLKDYYFCSLENNANMLNKSSDLAGIFVLYGESTMVTAMKEGLCAIIKGKGGGRPGKLQGTASKLQMLEEVESFIKQFDGT